jgi:branched-chain amino acid transport system ATP-binding protein
VLTEVGDDEVLEQLDTGPDPEHGPEASASMLAGPVSETVSHGDGERVTVSKGASKAEQVSATAPEKATVTPAGKAVSKPSAAKPATAKPTATTKSAPAKAAPKSPAAASKGIANRLAAPRGGRPDDLLAIKGIGPVNQRKLNEHGIFHFDQIGAWKKADVEAAEAYLAFDGRIAREDWVGQAKALAKAAAKQASAKHKAATTKRGGRK